MWPLKNLRCFCDTDHEWHAILCGLFFPFWLWPFILKWGSGLLITLIDDEPHYVGLGMALRLGIFILLLGAVL